MYHAIEITYTAIMTIVWYSPMNFSEPINYMTQFTLTKKHIPDLILLLLALLIQPNKLHFYRNSETSTLNLNFCH